MPKSMVVRVSGIAEVHESQHIREQLGAIISPKLDTASEGIQFTVIDIIPSCYEDHHWIALVEFTPSLPKVFRSATGDEGWSTDTSLGSLTFDASFHGFTQLYSNDASRPVKADIVLVHGLNGHPYGSWRAKDEHHMMWPRDFLRQSLPDCRIMIWGYSSSFKVEGNHSALSYTQQLQSGLRLVRKTSPKASVDCRRFSS